MLYIDVERFGVSVIPIVEQAHRRVVPSLRGYSIQLEPLRAKSTPRPSGSRRKYKVLSWARIAASLGASAKARPASCSKRSNCLSKKYPKAAVRCARASVSQMPLLDRFPQIFSCKYSSSCGLLGSLIKTHSCIREHRNREAIYRCKRFGDI